MEALAALREHLIKGKNVKLDGEDLVLLDLNNAELQRFPKSTETAFHSKSSKKPYDLLAVYTCYKYASLNFSEYVTKCRAEKAAMVLTIDKKELIAYLKGDIETSAQISASKDQQKAQGDATAAAVPESKKRKISHEEELQHKQKEHRRENEKPSNDLSTGSVKTSSVDDSALKQILAKEYTHRNRTTVLGAPTKTFENVLKSIELVNAEAKEKFEKAASKSAAPTTAALATSARKDPVSLSKLLRNKIHGTPIIVVPAGFSDLFTMLNAKDFLQDGIYVSNLQKKSEGKRKEQSFTISHEENGEKFHFKVVDNVSRFTDKHWRCVVAVIVSGQAWQFKGWKWKFPLEVFRKVCGIHIHLQGSQLSEEIKKWDVKILMIHPDKRHLDKVASREFWRNLFLFLRLKLQ